jgi:hypothetical protein
MFADDLGFFRVLKHTKYISRYDYFCGCWSNRPDTRFDALDVAMIAVIPPNDFA